MASHAAGAKRPPSLLLARWVLFVGGVYLLLLGLLVSVWGASKAWVPHRGFGGHVFDAPELGLPAEAGGARVQDTRAVSTEAPNRETAAPRDSADGEGAAMCPVSASGAKCLSPYQHEGSWRTGCFNGTCPTELALEGGTRGQFEECVMAPCADVARGTKTPSSPHPRRRPRRAAAGSEDGGSSSDAAADPPSVDPNFCESEFDTCPCTPLVTYQCGKVRHANCTDACDAYLRYLSRPPSFPTLHSPNADLCSKLFDSWRAFAPARPEDVGRLRNYTAPPFDEVKRHFAGTGIVIASGGRRLPSAIALALFIRNVLKSTLPIEIWLAEDEPPPSTDMLFILHAHDVTFFQLTEDCGYFRFRWTKRWRTRGEKNVMSDSEVLTWAVSSDSTS
ncbi:hypothetical protein DIPPA_34170 [Diplonema papillatum]|nr:hypothetical protein DIPPA_34170 [Diplonema papillatum]